MERVEALNREMPADSAPRARQKPSRDLRGLTQFRPFVIARPSHRTTHLHTLHLYTTAYVGQMEGCAWKRQITYWKRMAFLSHFLRHIAALGEPVTPQGDQGKSRRSYSMPAPKLDGLGFCWQSSLKWGEAAVDGGRDETIYA